MRLKVSENIITLPLIAATHRDYHIEGKKYVTFQVCKSAFDFVCLKEFYQVDSNLLFFA